MLARAAGLPADRRDRAVAAGHAAARKLQGQAGTVPPSPAVPGLRNSWWVVLRGLNGEQTLNNRWRSLAPLVTLANNQLGPDCVCHGWATLLEAELYCAAAGQPLPPRT